MPAGARAVGFVSDPNTVSPSARVISCDNVITIPMACGDEPVGRVDEVTRARLDHALRYALDIVYRTPADGGAMPSGCW